MFDAVIAAYRDRFGEEPTILAAAPGRVNLIGEHTDYNDGFVFPVAIDRRTVVAAGLGAVSELVSLQVGEAPALTLADARPGEVEAWSKYVAGTAWGFREAGLDAPDLRAVVSSDIPMGSGVSSSAALEMAFAAIWDRLGGYGLSPRRRAEIGKRCENGFVGVNSGIMDQMASASGREGRAMFLDTRSLEIRYAAIPAEWAIVLLDTKTPRTLAGSAYNDRRARCEEAAAALGKPALRDVTLEELEAARDRLDPVVHRRARHVVTENARCLAFADALDAGNAAKAGALMRASHESLRDDYEVSAPALDRMAESAQGAPGVIGARMTGAGFGGACVALVEAERAEEFIAATLAAYGEGAEAMVCRAVDGASAFLVRGASQ